MMIGNTVTELGFLTTVGVRGAGGAETNGQHLTARQK